MAGVVLVCTACPLVSPGASARHRGCSSPGAELVALDPGWPASLYLARGWLAPGGPRRLSRGPQLMRPPQPRSLLLAERRRRYRCIAAPSSAAGWGSSAPNAHPRAAAAPLGTGPGCPVSLGRAAKSNLPGNPDRLLVMGRKGRHSVVRWPGAVRTAVLCPPSVPGSVRRGPGERQGVQMFPVPERNVSGLGCWLCQLLPWKLGFCPLLGPFCFFHQPGDRCCGSPLLSQSSHHSAASSAPSAVPCCPSSMADVTVIPSHSPSLVPFGTAGVMPTLSSPAFGTQQSFL